MAAKKSAKSKVKAYFFRDKKTGKVRNTAIFGASAAAAKKKLRRPSPENAVVDSVRAVKPGEAKGGKWSRIRSDGKSPAKSRVGKGRAFGPPRAKGKRR